MAGPAKTSLSEWQDGLTRAVGDAKWHAWDCEIQAAVNEYNRHLSATAGYLSLHWRTIKGVRAIPDGAMCVFDVVDRRGRGQFARDRQVAMRGGAQLSPGVTTARCRRGFAV